ncbi:MAG: class I SAM-dependent methyltransferase [Coleofasciculus chthonoplastes F3-SA18-01]
MDLESMQPITTKIFELEDTLKSWDAHYYQPLAQHYYDQAIPTMLKLMEVKPGATVLDAGCGPGVHSIRVAKEGYRVCAIDTNHLPILTTAHQSV